MDYVQAFITNISFPTSLDELYDYSKLFDLEKVLGIEFFEILNDNSVFINDYEYRGVEWTSPKWCKKGDIVFFMHAKYAFKKINTLKKELISKKHELSKDSFWIMMNSLVRAKHLHSIYGGKIFAIGRVSGKTEFDNNPNNINQHWRSKIYAPIDSIFLLEYPIDISDFKSEILVSRQSSITPVFGDKYEFLKDIIIRRNKILENYFIESISTPIPLSTINDDNWLEIANEYRRHFFLEEQFRTFYTNYLLKLLGDTKTFFRECMCKKTHFSPSYVDNVIKFEKKYLPVEIKLSVSSEHDIYTQLAKYCNLTLLVLSSKKSITKSIYNNVLVIDTENVFMYYPETNILQNIFCLESISSNNDIFILREKISKALNK